MKKLLLILLCLPMIGFGQNKVNRTNPKSTAKAILIAYKSKDLRMLSSLSHSYNVQLFTEMTEQDVTHPRYNSLWKGWRWDAVNNWDGHSLKIIKENEKSSRVKFGESEVDNEDYVVTLHWEDGKWCFEDIHSPSKMSAR